MASRAQSNKNECAPVNGAPVNMIRQLSTSKMYTGN